MSKLKTADLVNAIEQLDKNRTYGYYSGLDYKGLHMNRLNQSRNIFRYDGALAQTLLRFVNEDE